MALQSVVHAHAGMDISLWLRLRVGTDKQVQLIMLVNSQSSGRLQMSGVGIYLCCPIDGRRSGLHAHTVRILCPTNAALQSRTQENRLLPDI